MWRDRADLRDEIERLESELGRQREIEEALRNTLLSAERMADELRARAHHEADLIVEEARAKAREIAATAEAEEQRVRDEIRRLRGLETDVRAEFGRSWPPRWSASRASRPPRGPRPTRSSDPSGAGKPPGYTR